MDRSDTDYNHNRKIVKRVLSSPFAYTSLMIQSSSETIGALDRLRGSTSNRWPNIYSARALSREKLDALASAAAGYPPTDEGGLVVFGSLARGEFTKGSDLDWTLLIDGRADSAHLDVVHDLKRKFKDIGFPPPGPTEVFGGLVFSHELIHAIGGDEDTNKNMTRRLLLLLESSAVEVSASTEIRDRVILGILHRYVQEDAGFLTQENPEKQFPRFLLNDVVRFWRTMAVDYANKYRMRATEKWALRNIKLRMSRKLLFVSGLFMCLSWKLSDREVVDQEIFKQRLVAHLQAWTQRSPLESLAIVVEKYAPSLAGDIFDSYDLFLQLLADEEKRMALERLSPKDVPRSAVFSEAREFSKTYDAALTRLLFDSHTDVSMLIKKYGVF